MLWLPDTPFIYVCWAHSLVTLWENNQFIMSSYFFALGVAGFKPCVGEDERCPVAFNTAHRRGSVVPNKWHYLF